MADCFQEDLQCTRTSRCQCLQCRLKLSIQSLDVLGFRTEPADAQAATFQDATSVRTWLNVLGVAVDSRSYLANVS